MKILAIESSCDETSIAVVEDGKKVLSNVTYTQIEIHKLYGGVVPEVASRHHIEKITYVLDAALKEAKLTMDDIDRIAVTSTPGLVGSWKGLRYARNSCVTGPPPRGSITNLK